jgi:hypothetical protein
MLKFPLKEPFRIWQYFGNPNPVYNGLGIIGHNGMDLEASHGTPVYASQDGTAYYEFDNNGGRGVVIISDTTFPYKGQQVYRKTIYYHLVDSSKEPQYTSPIESGPRKVKAGDLIGYADNTGFSFGSHLHYGLKFQVNGQTIDYDNGYKGAQDPFPYLPVKKYKFLTPMEYGFKSDDINHLQHFLYQRGYMQLPPYDQQGIYGNKTAEGVLKFQIAKVPLTFNERWVLRGKKVGPKTLYYLNQG